MPGEREQFHTSKATLVAKTTLWRAPRSTSNQRSMKLVLLAIACLAACALADYCKQITDCGACTEAGCGWCENSGSGACLAGSSTGPSTGSCNTWTWNVDNCPAYFCAKFNDCLDCVNQTTCGWCGLCMPGNATGPIGGGCDQWEWTPKECTSGVCPHYGECWSCTKIGFCGWCEGSNSCEQGTEPGPVNGTCKGNWDFTQGQCPIDLGE